MCDDSFQEGNFLAEFDDDLADEPIFAAKPSENDPILDSDLNENKRDKVSENTQKTEQDKKQKQNPSESNIANQRENKNGPPQSSDQQVKTSANTYVAENQTEEFQTYGVSWRDLQDDDRSQSSLESGQVSPEG